MAFINLDKRLFHLFDTGHQRQTFRGQFIAFGFTFKQLGTQGVFQRLNAPCHGAVFHFHQARSIGEGFGPGQDQKKA